MVQRFMIDCLPSTQSADRLAPNDLITLRSGFPVNPLIPSLAWHSIKNLLMEWQSVIDPRPCLIFLEQISEGVIIIDQVYKHLAK